uniref:Uncharacterized protein n=1 Tax=Rhizophora mucronata TaxID=61149 RepID=A0A2P2PZB7_RHIMU
MDRLNGLSTVYSLQATPFDQIMKSVFSSGPLSYCFSTLFVTEVVWSYTGLLRKFMQLFQCSAYLHIGESSYNEKKC